MLDVDIDYSYRYFKKPMLNILYFEVCKNDKFLDHLQELIIFFVDRNTNYFGLKVCKTIEFIIVTHVDLLFFIFFNLKMYISKITNKKLHRGQAPKRLFNCLLGITMMSNDVCSTDCLYGQIHW